MQTLPSGARTRNVTGRDTCNYCIDQGLVVTSTRPSGNPASPYEQYGPCPYCERGFAHEFPAEERGAYVGQPGVWGSEGYWSSRAPQEAAAVERIGGSKTLSILANRERLEELMLAMEEKRQARERAEEERKAAERAERLAALKTLAAEHSREEVGDQAVTGSASDGDVVAPGEGEGDAATPARDPSPVPPPAESWPGLFE